MADDEATTETPSKDRSAKPTAPAPKAVPPKKPVISKGAIIVLVASVAGMLTVGWFREEIISFKKLKPWDKGSPCAFVDTLSDAIKANDEAGVRAALGGPQAIVDVADGKISAVKSAMSSPQMPSTPAELLVLAGKASDGSVEYSYHPVEPSVSVSAETQAGGVARFELMPTPDGSWVVMQWNVPR